jgi:hypothetical protein
MLGNPARSDARHCLVQLVATDMGIALGHTEMRVAKELAHDV